jgi:hypothetical protein
MNDFLIAQLRDADLAQLRDADLAQLRDADADSRAAMRLQIEEGAWP